MGWQQIVTTYYYPGVTFVQRAGWIRGMNLPPESAWGYAYRAPFFWPDAADNVQSVVSVVARDNNTTVAVQDGTGSNGFQVVDIYGNITNVPGNSWSGILHAGYVIQLRNMSPAARITSAPGPIQAVAWNNQYGWIRGMDLAHEYAWGNAYRTPAFWDSPADNAQSVVSVVARDNNTTVTVQDGTGWNGFQMVTLWGEVTNVTGQSWSGVLQAGWVIQLRNTSPAALITSGANAIQVSAWNNEYAWVRGASLRWQDVGWGTAYRAPLFWPDAANNDTSVLSLVARDASTTVTIQDGTGWNGFQVVDLWGNITNVSGSSWSGTLHAGWIIQFRNTSPAARVTANKPIQVVAWNNHQGCVRGMNLWPESSWGTAHRAPAFWADPANNQNSIISVVARLTPTTVTVVDGNPGYNGFQMVNLWGEVTNFPGQTGGVTLEAGWVVQFRNTSPSARITATNPVHVVGWNNECG